MNRQDRPALLVGRVWAPGGGFLGRGKSPLAILAKRKRGQAFENK
jgi:hypothetical protein